MEELVNNLPCIYFSIQEDGTLLTVNKRLCSRLGYSIDEIVGQKIDIIFTVSTRIFQQTHFFPLLKMQGFADEIYITLRKKNGETLPVLINSEKVTQLGQDVYQYVGIVVSNRDKFEEELIEAKKIAEKALNENSELIEAKLEMQHYVEELDKQLKLIAKQNDELKQFSRVVSHNLQEPLRKLSLFTGLLVNTHDANDQHKYIDKLNRANDQLKSVITGLQQYIWLIDAPYKFNLIEVDTLFGEVLARLKVLFSNVNINIGWEKNQIIEGDKEQLLILIYELFSNCINFRREKNAAFISVTVDSIQMNLFNSVKNKYKFGNFIRIGVRDEGIGFNPEFKEQAFQLFKTLHRESGKGIGLSLCNRVVSNHNGTIDINSEEGKWTMVTIYLPHTKTNSDKLKSNAESINLMNFQERLD